jgi:hypothetical protein
MLGLRLKHRSRKITVRKLVGVRKSDGLAINKLAFAKIPSALKNRSIPCRGILNRNPECGQREASLWREPVRASASPEISSWMTSHFPSPSMV